MKGLEGFQPDPGTPLDRFLSRVSKIPGGCWEWIGYRDPRGYCRFHPDGSRAASRRPGFVVLSHRWSYEHFVGPVPDGMEVHHKCEVRWCVNPDHLETVPISAHRSHHAKKRWAVA
jgi:HNH endonuclease